MARKFTVLLSFAFFGIFSASPALAQTTVWGIDSVNSTARLFVASSHRRDARINVGVARLSGEIKLNAGDSLPSAFIFQIYPADKYSKLLQPQGGGPAPHPLYGSHNTLLTFQSSAIEPRGKDTFRVRGALTATYVSRYPTYTPCKAYSGPEFGPPVTHTTTREATFLFRLSPRTRTRKAKKGTTEWVASSAIPSDLFPDLWNAVVTTDWPTFFLGEQCVMPAVMGEDFSGQECSGKVVQPEPRTDIRCVMPSVGEDFSGVTCTGTPLSLVPITEEVSVAGAGAQASTGSQGVSSNEEVEIKLDMRLATANSALPKSASTAEAEDQ